MIRLREDFPSRAGFREGQGPGTEVQGSLGDDAVVVHFRPESDSPEISKIAGDLPLCLPVMLQKPRPP